MAETVNWELMIAGMYAKPLRTSLDLIERSLGAALAEFDAALDELRSEEDSEFAEFRCDIISEEKCGFEAARRSLHATLAILVAGAGENYVGYVCKRQKCALRPRPLWGDKVRALETEVGIVFKDLPGFKSYDRARLLANCFKHEDGIADEALAKRFPDYKVGEDIRYEEEDWPHIINETASLLGALAKKLPKGDADRDPLSDCG